MKRTTLYHRSWKCWLYGIDCGQLKIHDKCLMSSVAKRSKESVPQNPEQFSVWCLRLVWQKSPCKRHGFTVHIVMKGIYLIGQGWCHLKSPITYSHCCTALEVLYQRRKVVAVLYKVNKKFELMLTGRAKAYTSSCSQTVSLSSAISSRLLRRYRSLMPSWTVKIYVQCWKFHTQLVYLNNGFVAICFCIVSQPEIAKKSIKPRHFGVQGHSRSLNWAPVESQWTTFS